MTMQVRQSRRHGVSVIYMMLMLVVLTGFASFAVDWGRVQMIKAQLMRATEAAARYGAVGLENGSAAATANALASLSDNTADGSPIVVNPATDIEFGNWDSVARTFTVVTGAAADSANAIRVTVRRTSATGQSIALYFGKTIGRNSVDMTVSSIAVIHRGNQNTMSVPATSCMWLAGSPAGTVANPNNPHNNPDYAGTGPSNPGQSPVAVSGITVTPGARITFDSINGGANNFSSSTMYTPDGNTGWVTDNLWGAENGKSDCFAPINAVVGVFLGPSDPASAGTPPPPLDFSTQQSRDFSMLSPQLRQVFFIGDGRRDNGAVQQFVVPPGATRLFIGTMDQFEWNNNVGSYSVTAHNVGTVSLVK